MNALFDTTVPPFVFHQGTAPLLISMPHVGTHVPPSIAGRLTPEGREVHDTDWHLPLLYDFAKEMGASILQATHSRYVIDLNRPPDGASLYPGQSVTGLCPVDTFNDTPLYLPGQAPGDAEVAARREAIWRPYHDQLAAELARIRAVHGVAMLWDAHSIRSVVPRFFEGKLPDFNLGTADGHSCAPELAQQLLAIAQAAPGLTAVLNGRFKGGHITRHYGQPAQKVHAVQMEMTQCSYMQETMPFDYLPEQAARVQPTLRALLQAVLAYARQAGHGATDAAQLDEATCVRQLAALVGPAAVQPGGSVPTQYLTDWSGMPPVHPLAWVCPGNTEAVSRVMAWCHANRVPVVPQGGLTGLAGGAVPLSRGIALSLSRMNAIEPVDVNGATVTVEAGATLEAVQAAAQAAGLMFGVDLGARGSCQIGGNLATNAGGNGVVQYGMMREQTLGLEVVLADGTVLPMLRPMLKNNTGYDLKHWFIGSEGTLGIITKAVLALRPAPRARLSLMVAFGAFAHAVGVLRRLQSAFPGTLAAFELMWADFFQLSVGWSGAASPFGAAYPFVALVDVTGDDEASLSERVEAVLGAAMEDGLVLDAVLAHSTSQARALWHIREATAEFPTRMAPINFDISLPLERMDAFANDCVAALTKAWPGHQTVRFGHLGDGNLHLTTDARSLSGLTVEQATHEVEALVYALVAERGGSVSAEHGIGQHKKPYLGASRTPAEMATMRAIKHALDPLGLLNPGKVFDIDNPA